MKKILFLISSVLIFMGCSTNNNGTVTVVPIAPTNLIGSVISTTQINLSWTDNATNEEGYKIERKTGNGNYTVVGSTGANITTYSDLGLTANTSYTYRVYAYNGAGNSLQYSNELTMTTQDSIPTWLTNGLIGYWPFNGNANDESGNGINGTVMSGTTISSDRNGRTSAAYYFDGIDGLNKGISLPIRMNGIEYSTSTWFQVMDTIKSGQNSSQTIFVMKPFGVFGVAFNHPYSPGKIMSCLGDSLDWQICAPDNPNSWNLTNKLNWHNLITVKTSTEYKYYLDGVLFRTQTITSNFNVPISTIYVGAIQISSGEVFRGKIDDIRIYNRALSQSEITYLATY
ncbi:MAG: fibronectin type III domain-containing protein [Sphingobacteriales bacterium]|nr:fibronectin type III domain-containing protein [Sphingobacteriales bacterium]